MNSRFPSHGGFLLTLVGGVIAVPVLLVLSVLLIGLGIWAVLFLLFGVLVLATFIVVNLFKAAEYLEENDGNHDFDIDGKNF